MADKTLSQVTDTGEFTGAELIYGVKGGDSRRSTLNNWAVTVTGGSTARTLPARFADAISVKDFGATGTDNSAVDDTTAFANAMAASKYVFVPPGTYRIADLTIPSGVTLFGASPPSHLTPYQSVSQIKKYSGAASAIFKTNGNRDITLQGLLIDGVDRSVVGVQSGGDNITLRDLTIIVCNVGYGAAAGSGITPQTSLLVNCRILNNINGIRGLIDSTIVGGAIASNKSHGIYLSSGSNFNNIDTRIEWNGDPGGGAFTEGWNVFAESCRTNIISGTIDAGYLGGVRMNECTECIISGVFNRNGRKNGGVAREDSHITLRDCSDITLNVMTREGLDDAGAAPTTPKYSLWLYGNTSQNDRITIYGDLTGNVSGDINETGNATTNLQNLSSGYANFPVAISALNKTAIPAGGAAGSGYKFSSTTNFGVFFGSGAPTLSAAKGSLYLRSDGTGTGDRAYINTDGGTTWTALTTAA